MSLRDIKRACDYAKGLGPLGVVSIPVIELRKLIAVAEAAKNLREASEAETNRLYDTFPRGSSEPYYEALADFDKAIATLEF